MTRLPPPLLGTMDKIVASSEMKVDTKMFINTPPSSSNHQVLRTNSKKSRRCSHHRSRNSSFCSDNNSGSAAQTQRRGMMLNIHKYFAIVAASLLSLLSVGVVHPSSTSGSILFVNAQQTAQQQQQQGGGGGGGGGASTSQGKPSKSEAIHPPAGLFEKLDSNHDSMLSIDEYTIGWPLIADEFPSSGGGGGISSFFLPKYKGGFWKAFTSGVAMILATEIGDKTFFIAAVLSMRQQRSAVFIGAVLSLYVMTVLSSIMGLVLPKLIPVTYTHILGGVLFLYFGVKLLLDAKGMDANQVSEELEEVEEELLHPKKDEESQEVVSSASPTKAKFTEVAIQSFTLTFLAEWGDRSQIATIALSAAKNPYGVTLGGCIGHTMCTGLAVLGGRMLAARISERTVSIGGGIIFLVFGIHSVFFES